MFEDSRVTLAASRLAGVPPVPLSFLIIRLRDIQEVFSHTEALYGARPAPNISHRFGLREYKSGVRAPRQQSPLYSKRYTEGAA
jgi:hypothetical protein